jgi:hypothetical protein
MVRKSEEMVRRSEDMTHLFWSFQYIELTQRRSNPGRLIGPPVYQDPEVRRCLLTIHSS